MTLYVSSWANITVAEVRDIWELLAGSTEPTSIMRVNLTQNNSETSQQLRIRKRVVSGAPTSGSVGETVVTKPKNGLVTRAYSGTVEGGNTIQLTGGTTELDVTEGFNILAGYEWRSTPDDVIVVPAGQYFVVELEDAPTSIPMNAILEYLQW